MGLKISQYGEKWRIEIVEEVFEFPDRATMELELKRILDMKEEYGKVRKC